jgi:hypothetical protein
VSKPVPPNPSPEHTPVADVADESAAPAEAAEDEAALPLNRAERRAKARQSAPSHVGPRQEQERQVRGARARTKRAR